MKSYRLVVRQQGRIVGHFETSGLDALEDICVARAMFSMAGGYQCELLVSDSERRMLESGDAPRDKCAHFREINGIAAAFQYLQKNYNPTAPSSL